MKISRSALLPHAATDMFRLVRDVAAYPEFLSWCVNSRVLEESADHQLASLDIRIGGINQSFTTRNRLEPGVRLTLSLVDGPFRHLGGEWRFAALGNEGSKVTLTLDFDFSSSLLSSAFRRGFAHVVDTLVMDFGHRADEVYGA